MLWVLVAAVPWVSPTYHHFMVAHFIYSIYRTKQLYKRKKLLHVKIWAQPREYLVLLLYIRNCEAAVCCCKIMPSCNRRSLSKLPFQHLIQTNTDKTRKYKRGGWYTIRDCKKVHIRITLTLHWCTHFHLAGSLTRSIEDSINDSKTAGLGKSANKGHAKIAQK